MAARPGRSRTSRSRTGGGRRRPPTDPKPAATSPPYVVFQVKRGVDVRRTGGVGLAASGAHAALWTELVASLPGAVIAPATGSLSREAIDDLVARAAVVDPTYEPYDFHRWFRVRTPKPSGTQGALARVRAHPLVETAYVLRVGPDPGVVAGDDPEYPKQGHLAAAPDGIDAETAWLFAGGDGAGQHLADVERGWTLDHEDLLPHGVAGVSYGVLRDAHRGHGTAVLGIAAAADNAVGCVGIAPHVAGISVWSIASNDLQAGSDDANIDETILAAAGSLAFGDVLLLEVQIELDDGGRGPKHVPAEVAELTRAAIHIATALGIVVVEAGGNGRSYFDLSTQQTVHEPFDLDTHSVGGRAVLDPSSPHFEPSRALVVSAATSAAPHAVLPNAPRGRRVDLYAWGEKVRAPNSNSPQDRSSYFDFAETSAASAIVAGAALSAQGMVEARTGWRLGPVWMRRLLRFGATPSAGGAADRIGGMPNLAAIAKGGIASLPMVWMRDRAEFVRERPDLPQSPDIILRRGPEPDPASAFGDDPGPGDPDDVSEPVERDRDGWIYLRLRNAGGTDPGETLCAVWLAEREKLLAPRAWTLVGKVRVPSVPVGMEPVVAPALLWPKRRKPRKAGPHVLIAVVADGLGLRPALPKRGNATQAVRWILGNPAVAARAFTVE